MHDGLVAAFNKPGAAASGQAGSHPRRFAQNVSPLCQLGLYFDCSIFEVVAMWSCRSVELVPSSIYLWSGYTYRWNQNGDLLIQVG